MNYGKLDKKKMWILIAIFTVVWSVALFTVFNLIFPDDSPYYNYVYFIEAMGELAIVLIARKAATPPEDDEEL